jgi:glutamate racemase
MASGTQCWIVSAAPRAAGSVPVMSTAGEARPIGVFDSGLGGLTVLRALIDLLPVMPTIYFGDTGRFPYGPKPADEVLKYSLEIADLLVDDGVQLLVVACNSATSVALDALSARYEIPVIGVVEPGMRAAAGVIGTVGTIASGAYQRAAGVTGVELTCAACPGFVEFVESGDVDSDQVHVLAERLLEPVRRADVDTLVLGCTHYPLLARTIGDVMGPDVVLVSSADETAFAARRMLAAHEAPSAQAHHRFITSGDPDRFMQLGSRFLGPEVVTAEAWQWS